MVKKGRNQTVLSAWDKEQKKMIDFIEGDKDANE